MVGDGGDVTTDAKQTLTVGNLAVLGEGGRVALTAGAEGLSLLLLSGRPIGEPIARYGPFVMNTREEIVQAMDDFRQGRLLD